jgi:polyhydroxyalkanoate synthesis regulator phasin
MREVKTHIYLAILGPTVHQRQQQQILEARESSKGLMAEWQEQQSELSDTLMKVEQLSVLPQSKDIKSELKEMNKKSQALKKSIAALSSQMQDLNDDLEMMNGGMVYVGTGKQSKKTGSEKMKLLPIWEVLPDQAVYNITWADEKAKKQVDDVLKGMSVHSQLLEDFHQDVPSLGQKLTPQSIRLQQWSACYRGQETSKDVDTSVQDTNKKATQQTQPETLWSLMNDEQRPRPALSDQISSECCLSVVKGGLPVKKASNKATNDSVESQEVLTCSSCYQNAPFGVSCASGHFVCTSCISMLISIETDDLGKLVKNSGTLRCPNPTQQCHPFCPEELECNLRRISNSVYEEYRNLQRKAYKLKEIIKETQGHTAEIPANWTDVKSDKYAVRLIPILAGTPEYLSASRKFKATCRQEHIVSVERIQNFEQWCLYREKKRAMEEKNKTEGINERSLFHGTHPAAVSLIVEKSFNRSYCGRNATAYGRGIYFARDASYSSSNIYSPPDDQGIKYMFLVKVLAGMTTVGDDDMVEPPPRPDGRGNFDSTCGLLKMDDLSDPSITVIYHDAQVYAEYLVRFRD